MLSKGMNSGPRCGLRNRAQSDESGLDKFRNTVFAWLPCCLGWRTQLDSISCCFGNAHEVVSPVMCCAMSLPGLSREVGAHGGVVVHSGRLACSGEFLATHYAA